MYIYMYIYTAQEASLMCVFSPGTRLLFDLYHHLRSNVLSDPISTKLS